MIALGLFVVGAALAVAGHIVMDSRHGEAKADGLLLSVPGILLAFTGVIVAFAT